MQNERDASPPPTEAALHEVAVGYLARYSATRATLARMLNKRIDRWAHASGDAEAAEQAAAAKRAVRDVVARLAASGAVDDATFAQARSRRLTRTGHSRRATAAHLASHGVPAEIVAEALPYDAAGEMEAAVAYARRRRFGPFHTLTAATEEAPERHRHELAALARAGFGREAAERALAMTPDEAETVLVRLRQT